MQFPPQQFLEWKVFKPNVVFHFLESVESKSVLRLSLQQFIYEVGGLQGPARGNV